MTSGAFRRFDPVEKLTAKQKAFADAYVGPAKLNGTEAARIAKYKGSDGTLRVVAHENLTKPNVRAYIDDLLTADSMTAVEVLREISDVARSEWRDHLQIVTDPKTDEVVFVKMDLRSKVNALELLGKAHKLFTDKIESQNTVLIREYADG